MNEYGEAKVVVDGRSRALAACSYFGWLVLIPILAEKKPNEWLRKHINCGLTLMLVSVILGLAAMPLMAIILPTMLGSIVSVANGYSIGMIGTVASVIAYIAYFVVLLALSVLQIYLIIRAAIGEEAKMPLFKVGNYV